MSRSAVAVAVPSLSAEHCRVLRARLEIQRDFRVDQLVALADLRSAEDPADEPDEIVAALCRGAANALRETGDALRRMRDGSYGRCVDCTEALELGQLAAVPQAARCPTCERQAQAA